MSDVIASPSVRKLAGDHGVDLEERARALGRQTLTREDVLAEPPTSAAPTVHKYWEVDHAAHGPVREEPMSRFAQLAAQNLAAAQAMIPAVTHHDRADLTAVEAFRHRIATDARAEGVKLTTLAFHVKALARCLRAFERFNASLSPDGTTLVLKDYVHIGVAVDTAVGLVVPVVRNADRKGLLAIAREIAEFAGRAQARKLRPDEMGGASMTISNLGGIGGSAFTPIVNPPEVAILGITRTQTVPVWDGQSWQPTPMAPLDLSYDHRVINGADAARFLAAYTRYVAEPRRLVVM